MQNIRAVAHVLPVKFPFYMFRLLPLGNSEGSQDFLHVTVVESDREFRELPESKKITDCLAKLQFLCSFLCSKWLIFVHFQGSGPHHCFLSLSFDLSDRYLVRLPESKRITDCLAKLSL